MDRKIFRLAKPNISQKAISEVAEVLKSGMLVQGKKVAQFERELARYLNVKNAICVTSGTAALHLSLIALDIKQGGEVIVPAFTFPATANVVELVGAKPVFVDINLNDFCINANLIENKITDKTKAIIPVHEFGQAAEIDKILEIAKKHKLKVIEDAACALGTEFKDQKIGTFGETACFSFHPRKAITTGEGGVVVTNNNNVAEELRSLRNHGIVYEDGKIDFKYAGLNYRMTDFQAVLGIHQLKEIEEDIAHRLNLAYEYDMALIEHPIIKIPFHLFETRHVYQTYHVLFLKDEINRNNLITMLKKQGIETNLGAQALNCQTYYKQKYGLNDNDFPVATRSYKYGLALPIGRHISIEDVKEICDNLNKIVLDKI